jgi:hypothetical protein
MDFLTEYRRNSKSIEQSTSASSWSTESIVLLLDEDRNESTRACDRAAFGLDGEGLYFSFVEDRCLLADGLLLPEAWRLIEEPIR